MVAARLRLLDALKDAAASLVEASNADACAISRVIGDMLLLVTESAPAGTTLQQGAGYLVSEYPETRLVLATRRPRTACLDDADVDPFEAAVLRDLGFAALLMLPLELQGETWGLVELYRREPRPFDAAETQAAAAVLAGLRLARPQ